MASHIIQVLFLVQVLIIGVSCSKDHIRLLKDLMNDYDADVRPVCNESDMLTVTLGLALQQLISVDEKNQLVTSNVWLRMKWTDCHLQWNVTEYAGTSSILLSSKRIWIPDVTLYDDAATGLFNILNYKATVYPDGSVYFNAPILITSTCKIDVKWFPFDIQKCRLKFGSWAYHGFMMDLTNRSAAGDKSNYMTNGVWDLIDITVERNVFYYGCCVEPYPDVTFKIIIQRQSLFYIYNLVFPCVVITLVAMLGFLLPVDSGERISLMITVMLSLTVFLIVVSDAMPPTSETVPLIGQYFGATIAIVSVSCAATIFILNLHFKGSQGTRPPKWVKTFFLNCLAPLVCLKEYKPDDTNKVAASDFFHQSNKVEVTQIDEDTKVQKINGFTNSVFESQTELLKKFDKRLTAQEEADDINEEWRKIALVLDRFLLIVFSTVSFIITLTLLLRDHEEQG